MKTGIGINLLAVGFICLTSFCVRAENVALNADELGIRVYVFFEKPSSDNWQMFHGRVWNLSNKTIIMRIEGNRKNAVLSMLDDEGKSEALSERGFYGVPPEWMELWGGASPALANGIQSSFTFEGKIQIDYETKNALSKAIESKKAFVELELLIQDKDNENVLRRKKIIAHIIKSTEMRCGPH